MLRTCHGLPSFTSFTGGKEFFIYLVFHFDDMLNQEHLLSALGHCNTLTGDSIHPMIFAFCGVGLFRVRQPGFGREISAFHLNVARFDFGVWLRHF